jgi:hypothetical protein
MKIIRNRTDSVYLECSAADSAILIEGKTFAEVKASQNK